MVIGERIFLIAWEFPGYNTRGGTALAKRIGSLARGLSSQNEVTVITRNHFANRIEFRDEGFPIYLVPGPSNNPSISFALLRKFWTFLCVLLIGDQSGLWGVKAFWFLIHKFRLNRDDIVISFYTPRGPVLCGYLVKFFYGARFVVDFQDAHSDGLSTFLRPVGRFWFRGIVRSCNICVHVSPEWSKSHSIQLKKEFRTIRHALPVLPKVRSRKPNSIPLRLMYYGAFHEKNQFHPFFFDVIRRSRDLLFCYAGHESTHKFFDRMELGDKYVYKGWLDQNGLVDSLNGVDFLIIFGFKNRGRSVVPSKLYEYISLDLPILIVGDDSGGIQSLESEYNFRFNWALCEDDFTLSRLLSILNQKQSFAIFDDLSERNFQEAYHDLLKNA